MLPPECPYRTLVAFDDHRLVAYAGLMIPFTLAHRLGLSELIDHKVGLSRGPGRAKASDKWKAPLSPPSRPRRLQTAPFEGPFIMLFLFPMVALRDKQPGV